MILKNFKKSSTYFVISETILVNRVRVKTSHNFALQRKICINGFKRYVEEIVDLH